MTWGAAAKRLAAIAYLLLLAAFPAQGEKRVALVIGNSSYESTPALANPTNDADDIAAALQRIGFIVQVERNLTKRGMESALVQFARLAENADAALFFYAGHGIQYRGMNFLMPIDARLEDEISVNYELVRIDDVMFSLDRARGVKVVVLDACRNNPLYERLVQRNSTRDMLPTRGLARIDAARGTLIAYSTQANQVAVDGTGRNSPFTKALLHYIGEPGLEVGILFRRVAVEVERLTSGRQLPELWLSLRGEFYLNSGESDAQAWPKVRDSIDRAQLEDFIKRFPASALANDARRRIEAIERVDRARAEQVRAEQERMGREQAELARQAQERAAREQESREAAERERVQREMAAREQALNAHLEQERVAREQAARAERERLERERLAREQAEQAREAQARAAREQTERERAERQQQAERDRPAAEQAQRQETAAKATASAGSTQIVMISPAAEPAPNAPSRSSLALVKEIKTELKRIGCLGGHVDEKWATADTYAAMAKYARFANLEMLPDQPTSDFLDTLKRSRTRICPLECGVRQIEKDGACVAKVCPGGQQLRADGQCAPSAKPKPARREAAKPRGAGGGGGRRCFVLGGNSFCE